MEDKTITQYCQLIVPLIYFSANKAKATPNSVEPFTNLLFILNTSLSRWYREVSAGFKLVGSYIKNSFRTLLKQPKGKLTDIKSNFGARKKELNNKKLLIKKIMSAIIQIIVELGIPLGFVYLGYLFYDKNIILSVISFIVGIILGIMIINNDIKNKKRYHDAPWLFK